MMSGARPRSESPSRQCLRRRWWRGYFETDGENWLARVSGMRQERSASVCSVEGGGGAGDERRVSAGIGADEGAALDGRGVVLVGFDAGAQGLTGVEGGTGVQGVAGHVDGFGWDEGGCGDAGGGIRLVEGQGDRQTTLTVATVARDVPDGICGFWLRLVDLKALDAAGEFEVEACAVLRRDWWLVGESKAGVDDVEGLGGGVGDGAAAVGGGEVKAVRVGT